MKNTETITDSEKELDTLRKKIIPKVGYKTHRPVPNWQGFTKWFKLETPLITVCCDCGLAHESHFKVVKGSVYWKIKRHKLLTKFYKNKNKTPTLKK